MISIGFEGDDLYHPKNSYNLLNLQGNLIFRGKANLGIGTSIFAGTQGLLEFGNNITTGHNVKIICYHKITFGQTISLAWETQVYDTNFHYIKDIHSKTVKPKVNEIKIGDYCWITNRCTIAPGTILKNYTIVASNSFYNRDYSTLEDYPLIGGSPAKFIKSGFMRIFDLDDERMLNKKFGFEK